MCVCVCGCVGVCVCVCVHTTHVKYKKIHFESFLTISDIKHLSLFNI